MSETAALARRHRLLGIDVGVRRCVLLPLGSSTQTTPSQKAIRSKKNMTLPIIPDGCSAAFELNLADRLEAVVRIEVTFLGKIDANSAQIFVKFDRVEFD